jgi:hypothetical protein
MKKLFSKTAFSLLELIITSVLVVFVILGIFAVNGVLSNNNQDYGQRYFVKSETQTTLNHILNNASMAIGSGTNVPAGASYVPDQGILVGTAGLGSGDPANNPNSFCIHQDIPISQPLDGAKVNPSLNNPSSTPPNYNNSRWLCYTLFTPSNLCPGSLANCSSYQIWYCAWGYDHSLSYRGANNCSGSSNPMYLGTAFNISPSFSPTTGVFSVTLQNCLNDSETQNSLLTCNGGGSGISSDLTNNPESSLSGSVTPSQVGLQQT